MAVQQEPGTWFGADVVRMLPGFAPESETDLDKRVEAVLGATVDGKWQPTPFGEVVAMSMVALMCRAATAEIGVRAYIACEDGDAIDRLMESISEIVVDELRKAVAA